jgi:hypothetical protein
MRIRARQNRTDEAIESVFLHPSKSSGGFLFLLRTIVNSKSAGETQPSCGRRVACLIENKRVVSIHGMAAAQGGCCRKRASGGAATQPMKNGRWAMDNGQ